MKTEFAPPDFGEQALKANAASLTEHLQELRRRIIGILIVLVLSMIAGFLVSKRLISALLQTGSAAISAESLHAFSPWDAVRIYMQFSLLAGLGVALPFALFQVWLFVKPGLTVLERKATLRYIPVAAVLFGSGAAFGYWIVFPMALRFSAIVSESLGLTQTFGASQYVSFMFHIVLPMSLLFELPVVIMFLTHIRLLNPNRLRKMRKFAYLLLLVLATLVTPPDFISDLLVAIPLLVLYELGVWLSNRVYLKQQSV